MEVHHGSLKSHNYAHFGIGRKLKKNCQKPNVPRIEMVSIYLNFEAKC